MSIKNRPTLAAINGRSAPATAPQFSHLRKEALMLTTRRFFIACILGLAITACEDPAPPVSCGGGAVETVVTHPVTERLCFTDANGDVLSYTAQSSNPNVASVAASGDQMTVTGEGVGSATVTVTATDPGGLTGTSTYSVNVDYVATTEVTHCERDAQWNVEMDGEIRPNIDMHGVVVTGYVGTRRVGAARADRLEKGSWYDVSVRGRISPTTATSCVFDVDWSRLGAMMPSARVDQGAVSHSAKELRLVR